MMSGITPIVMPKWGLSMKEGTVMSWLVDEGADIAVGMPILEVETDKIANAVEAADPGKLRRRVAAEGDVLPVKALLGVMAGEDVSDAEIDAYIAGYVTPVDEDDGADAAPAYLYVEVDGVNVRYAKKGAAEGTPVIFIHGFGGDLDNWLFNIDAIGEKAPVIALDLPGHGQSTVKLPGKSIDALADFVGKFMAAINVPKAHLVGHSMGGAIISSLANRSKDKVASLTLIGSAGLGDEINSTYTSGFATAPSRKELKPLLELLFADPSLVNRQLVDDVLKYKRLDGVTELLTELGQALFANGKQASKPGLQLSGEIPVLVVWGAKDHIIPSSHSQNAKSAKIHILDDAGHMVQLEKAADVNRLIIQHIAS